MKKIDVKKIDMKKIAALLLSASMTFSLAACAGESRTDEPSSSRTEGESTGGEIAGGESTGGENAGEESTREESARGESTGEESAGTESGRAEGGGDEREPETSGNSTQPTDDESEAMSAAEPEAAGGKTLVVYYSATGHTEEVAGYIASALGADVFALEPVEPYSSDDLNWRDENSRVVREHENLDTVSVELTETTVSDWDSYSTVLIGYPIWWGIAAWPVNSFVEANDFTGKNVVPFCTSSSSELGESGWLLAETAGTGNWMEGQRFSSRASEDDVEAWVESLELPERRQ